MGAPRWVAQLTDILCELWIFGGHLQHTTASSALQLWCAKNFPPPPPSPPPRGREERGKEGSGRSQGRRGLSPKEETAAGGGAVGRRCFLYPPASWSHSPHQIWPPPPTRRWLQSALVSLSPSLVRPPPLPPSGAAGCVWESGEERTLSLPSSYSSGSRDMISNYATGKGR